MGASVDLDADQLGGANQHRVLERAEPRGASTAALGHDAQVAAGGHADGRGHLVLVGGEGDERGALVDGEVEWAAGGVPARRAGLEEDSRGVRGEGSENVIMERSLAPRPASGIEGAQTATPNFVSWGSG